MSDKLILSEPSELKRNWGWLLAFGILFVLLGCIGLGMVVGLTLASMFFLGVLLLIAGILQLIDSFKSRRWKGVIWHSFIGVLYLIGGGLILHDPILASTLITGLLATILIIIGISRMLMSILLRNTSGSIWIFLAGLISLALGIMILMQWPFSGLWIIGLFIAIEMLVNGWSYIFLALALRSK